MHSLAHLEADGALFLVPSRVLYVAAWSVG